MRLMYVSVNFRWASPLFAGLFAAGMFHTMLVYYLHVIYCILSTETLFI